MAKVAEQRKWLERAAAADEGELSALLDTLVVNVTAKQAYARLASLSVYPADPRIGDRLFEILCAPPWASSSGAPFWAMLFFTWLHHRPSSLTGLRDLADGIVERRLPVAGFNENMTYTLAERIPLVIDLLARDEAVRETSPAPLVEAVWSELLGDPESACAASLRLWRHQPSAAVERMLLHLSERIDRERITGFDRAQAWEGIAAERDPADMPRLLACVGKSPTTAMLEQLIAWRAPDPRVGMKAGQLMIAPPWNVARRVALGVAGLCVLHPSRMAVEAMTRHAEHDQHLAPLVAAMTSRLDEMAKAGDALAAPARVQEVSEALDVPAETHAGGDDEHLQAIYDSPDDVGPKLVYADLLLGRQDPRGEFIQLQCAAQSRKLGRAEAKRVRELLIEGFPRWVGTLEPILYAPHDRAKQPTWFQDGFLHAAALKSANPKLVGTRAEDPAWRTVRELHLAKGTHSLMTAANLQQVTHVTGLPLTAAKRLGGGLTKLETLEVDHVVTTPQDDKNVRDWTQLAERRGLRHLRLSGWMQGMNDYPRAAPPHVAVLDPIMGSPLAESLESIGLRYEVEYTSVEVARPYFMAFLERLASHHHVACVEIYAERSSRGVPVRFHRDGDRRFTRARFTVPHHTLVRSPYELLLKVIPVLAARAISSLEIEAKAPPKSLRRIEAQLERHQAELIFTKT